MTLKNVLNEILHVQCKTLNAVITFYKLTGISKSFCIQKIRFNFGLTGFWTTLHIKHSSIRSKKYKRFLHYVLDAWL